MATLVGFIITFALLGSAWLAYATTSPHGAADSSGGTTTTVVVTTPPTTTPETTTPPTTTPGQNCKPGNGFGDKNHCHSGPPGQNKG